MISLKDDFYDDTRSDDLEVSNDCSTPFADTSPLGTSTYLDTSEDVSIIPEPSLPLASLGELEEGDRFDVDASFDDQCGILVESEDTFSEEHSFDEPSDMEFSEVTPHIKLNDSIFVESTLDLAPTPSISSLSSPLPFFLPSLDPPESNFVEFETLVLGNRCLDHTLNDNDIKRLKGHFEVNNLALGHPTGFDFHISFD